MTEVRGLMISPGIYLASSLFLLSCPTTWRRGFMQTSLKLLHPIYYFNE